MNLPIHIPFAVLLVDDDEDVLANLASVIRQRLLNNTVLTASSTVTALTLLEAQALDTRELVPLIAGDVDCASDGLSMLAGFEVHRRCQERIGIVVLDYAMPGMTGIELAASAPCRHLSKMLLTGQASPAEAIAGFNADVIDRFVRKDDPGAIELLLNYLQELQEALLAPINSAALSSLGQYALPFLGNADVLAFLRRLSCRANAVWTTPSISPPGLSVVDGLGQHRTWLVMDSEMLRPHLEIARAAGAPDEFEDAITQGTHLPHFIGTQNSGGYFEGGASLHAGLHPVIASNVGGFSIAELQACP